MTQLALGAAVVAGALALVAFMRAQSKEDPPAPPVEKPKPEPRDFTAEELSKFKGENGSPVYLSLKNIVYEVCDACANISSKIGVFLSSQAWGPVLCCTLPSFLAASQPQYPSWWMADAGYLSSTAPHFSSFLGVTRCTFFIKERLLLVEQASFIRIKLQWGGGLGGGVFSRVGGSKALDPPPLL